MMRKKIKFFTITYVAFLFLNVVSCNPCSNSPDKYKITSFIWEVKKATLATNGAYALSDIENGFVTYNQFSILMLPEIEEYFSLNSSYTSTGIINSAYACDSAPATTTDKITNIRITSSVDFNPTFLAGSNLTSLFDIAVVEEENGFMQYDLTTYLTTQHTFPKIITILLKTAPDVSKNIDFTVKITLNAEVLDEFVFTTNPVEIRI